MDWDSPPAHLPIISTISLEATGPVVAGGVPASTVMTANLAIYAPLQIISPYLVQQVWWTNGASVAGNIDCGVYSFDGTLLFNSGSVVQTGTNAIQSVTLGTAVLLQSGNYYMAIVPSSGSATLFAKSVPAARVQNAAGLATQSLGALPLPANATFATAASNLPIFGIAANSFI